MPKLPIIENIALKIYFKVLEKLNDGVVTIPDTEEAVSELTNLLKKIIANNSSLVGRDNYEFKYNSLLSLLDYDNEMGITDLSGYDPFVERLSNCIANDINLYYNVVNKARIELENTVEASLESNASISKANFFHIEQTGITPNMLEFISKEYTINTFSTGKFENLTQMKAEDLYNLIPNIPVSVEEFVSVFETYIRNIDAHKICEIISKAHEDYKVIDSILLVLKYFLEEKPEDTAMYIVDFVKFINNICALIKDSLTAYINRYKNNVVVGNLVVGFNPVDCAVVVNGELYKKYIDSGYNDQAIFGFVVNNGLDITNEKSKFSYNEIVNNYEALVNSIWLPYTRKEEEKAKLTRHQLAEVYRTAIVNLFNNDDIMPDDLEDNLGISLDMTMLLFNSDKFGIKTIPGEILSEPSETVNIIINNYIFPMTRYRYFMEKMEKYNNMLDEGEEVDSSTLSSFAVMEYILDYLTNQIK